MKTNANCDFVCAGWCEQITPQVRLFFLFCLLLPPSLCFLFLCFRVVRDAHIKVNKHRATRNKESEQIRAAEERKESRAVANEVRQLCALRMAITRVRIDVTPTGRKGALDRSEWISHERLVLLGKPVEPQCLCSTTGTTQERTKKKRTNKVRTSVEKWFTVLSLITSN